MLSVTTLWDWLGWLFTGLGILLLLPFILIFTVVVVVVLRGVYLRFTNGHPLHTLRAKLGWGKNVAELARRLDVEVDELMRANLIYRPAYIPKRRGGTRKLDIPNDRLKQLQRRILRRLLARLRTHETATGFQRGTSIVHNAAAHRGQAVVIKMDIVDFFPTSSAERIERYFRRIGWNAKAAKLLTSLTTHDGALPQGAPTSPRLSNLINFAIDTRIDRCVRKRHGVYTRYADDITISFPEDWPVKLRGVIQYVRRICKANGYRVHTRGKLRVLRKHQQQRVTGLVVNNQPNLPRTKRRWLRAVEHRLRTTGKASLTQSQLDGWRALQKMIDDQRPSASVEK